MNADDAALDPVDDDLLRMYDYDELVRRHRQAIVAVEHAAELPTAEAERQARENERRYRLERIRRSALRTHRPE